MDKPIVWASSPLELYLSDIQKDDFAKTIGPLKIVDLKRPLSVKNPQIAPNCVLRTKYLFPHPFHHLVFLSLQSLRSIIEYCALKERLITQKKSSDSKDVTGRFIHLQCDWHTVALILYLSFFLFEWPLLTFLCIGLFGIVLLLPFIVQRQVLKLFSSWSEWSRNLNEMSRWTREIRKSASSNDLVMSLLCDLSNFTNVLKEATQKVKNYGIKLPPDTNSNLPGTTHLKLQGFYKASETADRKNAQSSAIAVDRWAFDNEWGPDSDNSVSVNKFNLLKVKVQVARSAFATFVCEVDIKLVLLQQKLMCCAETEGGFLLLVSGFFMNTIAYISIYLKTSYILIDLMVLANMLSNILICQADCLIHQMCRIWVNEGPTSGKMELPSPLDRLLTIEKPKALKLPPSTSSSFAQAMSALNGETTSTKLRKYREHMSNIDSYLGVSLACLRTTNAARDPSISSEETKRLIDAIKLGAIETLKSINWIQNEFERMQSPNEAIVMDLQKQPQLLSKTHSGADFINETLPLSNDENRNNYQLYAAVGKPETTPHCLDTEDLTYLENSREMRKRNAAVFIELKNTLVDRINDVRSSVCPPSVVVRTLEELPQTCSSTTRVPQIVTTTMENQDKKHMAWQLGLQSHACTHTEKTPKLAGLGEGFFDLNTDQIARASAPKVRFRLPTDQVISLKRHLATEETYFG